MIEYTLRQYARAKRINVTVRRDGSVLVTKPRRVPMRDVEAFIQRCEQWILRTRSEMRKRPQTSAIESPKRQYDNYKKAARICIEQRIAHFNESYCCTFSKISIRNQKTRWGSRSPSGVLSFNYRILFLPAHLADYIVVHELCHVREMNHSKRFWGLVALQIPDHQARRRELRKLEHGLLMQM